MTDLASLALKIDATEVATGVRELDKLTASGTKAEGSTKRLGITVEQAERHMRKASIVLGDMKLKEEAAAMAAEKLAKAQMSVTASAGRVTASAGAQRAGMQQLSYQINDVTTMFAMGARPMQIFASQGGQVVQALQMMSGGAGGLLGILAGPWGIAITSAVTVLVTLGATLWSSKSATDAFSDALLENANAADQAAAAYGRLIGMQKASTIGDIAMMQGQMGKLREEEAAILSRVERARGIGQFGEGTARQLERGDLSNVRQRILAVQNAINQGNRSLREQAAAEEKAATATEKSTKAGGARTAGVKAQSKALSEAERELERQIAASTRYAQSLEEQAAKFGMSAVQLHSFEVAAEAAAAPTAELAKRIREAGDALEFQMVAKANEDFAEYIRNLEDENRLLGLVGPERERAALFLEEQAFKAQMAAKGIEDVEGAWREYLRVRLEGLDKESALDRDAEAAERVNDQLREMVGLLRDIGGFGGVLGGVMEGLTTGDFGGLGPAGGLLNILLTPLDDLSDQVNRLSDGLYDIFGIGGSFGQSLAQALQGAGIGAVAGQVAFGGSGIGGAIGGALGGELGANFGPIGRLVGSVAGGILGGFVESLFGGASKGVVGIGGSGSSLSVFGTKHDDAERVAAATQAAESIIGSVSQIAAALGGTVNAANASLTFGMRDDKFVVDTTGAGRTKGSGVLSFDTQEQALKAAIEDLINDGVIEGLRAGTQRLLQSAGDLEQGLADALAFEAVFKEAEAAANPFAAALAELADRMEYLQDVFQRAGASAEEYAILQEYIARQQQMLVDQASSAYRSAFYTDAQNVQFAKDTISSTLTPLGFGDVNTVAEYKALVEATDALANPELHGALMGLVDEFKTLQDAQDAAKAQKAAEAAQKAAEREARLAEARNNLAQAYQRERSELEQTQARFAAFAESLRNFRDELIIGAASPAQSYALQLARLRSVGGLAALGDENALSQLPGVGRGFISAAGEQAGSRVELERAIGLVVRYTDSAVLASEGMMTEAEKQLAKLDEQVKGLIDINDSVRSVEQAIIELRKLLGGGGGNASGGRQAALYGTIQRIMERNPNSRALDMLIQRYEAQYGSIEAGLPENMSGGFGSNGSNRASRNTSDGSSGLADIMTRQQRVLERMDERWERMISNDGVGLLVRTDPDLPLTTVST